MERSVPTILKVKDFDGDERFKDIHPNLPQMPSLTLLIGSIKSGKSNLVINMLCNPQFYLNKFDIVRVLSSTLHMDNKMKILAKHFDADDHYEDRFIDEIVASQGEFEKDDPLRPKYCLVLDDILTTDFMKRSNKLSFFATTDETLYRYDDYFIPIPESYTATHKSPSKRFNCSQTAKPQRSHQTSRAVWGITG